MKKLFIIFGIKGNTKKNKVGEWSNQNLPRFTIKYSGDKPLDEIDSAERELATIKRVYRDRSPVIRQ